MKAIIITVLFACLVPACKKQERSSKKAEDGPEPISVKEQERGQDACADFKKRACACASEHPDNGKLETDCKLADSRIEALNLSARVSATENSSAADRSAGVTNARRVVSKCIERSAELAKNCGVVEKSPE